MAGALASGTRHAERDTERRTAGKHVDSGNVTSKPSKIFRSWEPCADPSRAAHKRPAIWLSENSLFGVGHTGIEPKGGTMKRSGVLHGELSEIIANLGHGQLLVIGDAGLPIPAGVRRIDLAVRPGLPAFLDVLAAVLAELPIESCAVASELFERNPDYYQRVAALVDAPIERISHEELKAESQHAVAVIRTGEWTPYANVILRAGVVF